MDLLDFLSYLVAQFEAPNSATQQLRNSVTGWVVERESAANLLML
jgi:hypothetical protein